MIIWYSMVQKHEIKVNTIKARLLDSIEIELVDENGNPVADEEYILYLPDGKERKGKVDSKGYAKEKDIPPGELFVKFLNLEEVDVED